MADLKPLPVAIDQKQGETGKDLHDVRVTWSRNRRKALLPEPVAGFSEQ